MEKRNYLLSVICYLLFIVYWLFTIRPLFLGQLTGNFRPQTIPHDYVRLKDMLIADTTPSRTLWLPGTEKFAFASDIHPMLSGTALFENASVSGLLTLATSSSFLSSLNDAGVRFVVVPKDVEGNMFMTEYRSDPALREQTIQTFEQTPLIALPQFEEIAVFENPSFTAMRNSVPETVGKQQRIANVGLVVGGSITLLLGVWIFVSSWKKK